MADNITPEMAQKELMRRAAIAELQKRQSGVTPTGITSVPVSRQEAEYAPSPEQFGPPEELANPSSYAPPFPTPPIFGGEKGLTKATGEAKQQVINRYSEPIPEGFGAMAGQALDMAITKRPSISKSAGLAIGGEAVAQGINKGWRAITGQEPLTENLGSNLVTKPLVQGAATLAVNGLVSPIASAITGEAARLLGKNPSMQSVVKTLEAKGADAVKKGDTKLAEEIARRKEVALDELKLQQYGGGQTRGQITGKLRKTEDAVQHSWGGNELKNAQQRNVEAVGKIANDLRASAASGADKNILGNTDLNISQAVEQTVPQISIQRAKEISGVPTMNKIEKATQDVYGSIENVINNAGKEIGVPIPKDKAERSLLFESNPEINPEGLYYKAFKQAEESGVKVNTKPTKQAVGIVESVKVPKKVKEALSDPALNPDWKNQLKKQYGIQDDLTFDEMVQQETVNPFTSDSAKRLVAKIDDKVTLENAHQLRSVLTGLADRSTNDQVRHTFKVAANSLKQQMEKATQGKADLWPKVDRAYQQAKLFDELEELFKANVTRNPQTRADLMSKGKGIAISKYLEDNKASLLKYKKMSPDIIDDILNKSYSAENLIRSNQFAMQKPSRVFSDLPDNVPFSKLEQMRDHLTDSLVRAKTPREYSTIKNSLNALDEQASVAAKQAGVYDQWIANNAAKTQSKAIESISSILNPAGKELEVSAISNKAIADKIKATPNEIWKVAFPNNPSAKSDYLQLVRLAQKIQPVDVGTSGEMYLMHRLQYAPVILETVNAIARGRAPSSGGIIATVGGTFISEKALAYWMANPNTAKLLLRGLRTPSASKQIIQNIAARLAASYVNKQDASPVGGDNNESNQ